MRLAGLPVAVCGAEPGQAGRRGRHAPGGGADNAGARSVDVTLAANGVLVASSTQVMRTPPHRLILDFAGVTPAVPAAIPVDRGAVERVRVASFSASPQVTRVVFDLARSVPYTLNAVGNELHVNFAEGEASPAEAASPEPAGAGGHRDASGRRTAADPRAGRSPARPPPGEPTCSAPRPARRRRLAQVQSGTQRRYTGHPVTLDFQGADLRAVLRTFSEISGLNIVIDPAVQGSVDVALRDVPWDQALDSILRANKLGYVVDGTIVRVAPITVLSEEEASRRKLSEEQALSGELKVMTKALNYAEAEELAPLLKGNALSARGTVAVDSRTNTVVINDLPLYLAKAEALLNSLDQSEGQVEIEARIVSTSKTFAHQLGVKWGFLGQATPELGNTTGVSFPNTVTGNISVNPSGNTTALPNVASLVLGSVNGGAQPQRDAAGARERGKDQGAPAAARGDAEQREGAHRPRPGDPVHHHDRAAGIAAARASWSSSRCRRCSSRPPR